MNEERDEAQEAEVPAEVDEAPAQEEPELREISKEELQEIEEKCREQFGCEIDDLPSRIERCEKEAEEALAKAENLLEIER